MSNSNVRQEGIEVPLNGLQEFVKKLVEWRRLIASAVLAMVAVGICAHAILGANGWIPYRQKKAEYQDLQRELKSMDEENKRLDAEIKALKSDPKAIEKEAREQLRYAKPGEMIYLLPEQRPAPTPQRMESAKR